MAHQKDGSNTYNYVVWRSYFYGRYLLDVLHVLIGQFAGTGDQNGGGSDNKCLWSMAAACHLITIQVATRLL